MIGRMKMSKVAMLKKDQATGQTVAGFLNKDTGVFEVVKEIATDKDIDQFMDEYDLSVVMVSKR